jgi:hypothetical protein
MTWAKFGQNAQIRPIKKPQTRMGTGFQRLADVRMVNPGVSITVVTVTRQRNWSRSIKTRLHGLKSSLCIKRDFRERQTFLKTQKPPVGGLCAVPLFHGYQ